MTVYITRHCELAKQSGNLMCIRIASQARNDENSACIVPRTDGARLKMKCTLKNLFF